MDKATDFQSLGLEEIFDDLNALTIIEWADRMVDKLPKNRIDIKITVLESEKRLFEIAYHDR
jgi:tRNA A37 threonylcarbamoyladenosine biosynthesis protein TsaE